MDDPLALTCFALVLGVGGMLVAGVVAVVLVHRLRREVRGLEQRLVALEVTRSEAGGAAAATWRAAAPAAATAADDAPPRSTLAEAIVPPTGPSPEPAHAAPPAPPAGVTLGGGASVSAEAAPVAGARPPTATLPEATSSSAAAAGAPAEPTTPWWSRVEESLGARLPVWLGAVALALAGGFLVKYTVDQGWIGPTVRVALGVSFGLALEAAAVVLRRPTDRIAAALAAAGVAVLYASFLAAVHLYALLGVPAGFALMAATTAAAVALSLVHGPIVAVVGMVGGFLTPYWLSSAEPQPRLLFSYLLMVHLGVLAVSRRRDWLALPSLSLAVCLTWGGVFLAAFLQPGEGFWVALFLLAALVAWLVVFSLELAAAGTAGGRRAALGLFVAVAATLVTIYLVARAALQGQVLDGTVLALLVPVAGGLVLLGRLRPRLEVLAWMVAGAAVLLVTLWGASWDHAVAGVAAPEPFPAGLVVAVLLGFAAVLVGGGLAALPGSPAPGRWATFAAASGVALYLAASLWPPALAPWRALGDAGLALVGAVAFAVAAHLLGTPRAAGGDREAGWDVPLDQLIERWALPSVVRPALAWAAMVLLSIAVFRGTDGVARTALFAAVVVLAAGLASRPGRGDLRPLAVLPAALALWRVGSFELFDGAVDGGVNPAWWAVTAWAGLPLAAVLAAVRLLDAERPAAGEPAAREVGPASSLLRFSSPFFLVLLVAAWVELALRRAEETAGLVAAGAFSLVPLAVGAAVLAVAARRTRWAGAAESWAALCILGWGWLRLMLGAVSFGNPLISGDPVGPWPIVNHLLWIYGGACVLLAGLARLLAGGPQDARGRLPLPLPLRRFAARLAAVSALVLLPFLVTLEVFQAFRGGDLQAAPRAPLAESWALSIAWLLLGIVLLVAGIAAGSRLLRAAALAVTGLAVVKVFVFDVGRLGDLWRVLSFLGLGASLLLLAWLYQRFVFRRAATALVLVALGAGLLAACGGDEATGPSLWAEELAPLVLVEEATVALPDSDFGEPLPASRFLAGWAPWIHQAAGGDRPVMAARRGGARMQVVHLADRPRSLHLDLVGPEGADAGAAAQAADAADAAVPLQVRVTAAGRPVAWAEVGEVAWGDPLEVPLPAGMPPGRLVVEVERRVADGEPSPPLDVVAARLRPSLPAGEVEWRDGDLAGGDLVQGGWSRVEAVRRVAPGEAIHGTFRPPDDAVEGQVFRAVVEDERGAALSRFEWRQGQPGWSQPVRLPTGDREGLVRLVLSAEGEGPPATWEGLRWRARRPAPAAPRPARWRPPTRDGDETAPRLVMVYVMDALRADHVAAVRGAATGVDGTGGGGAKPGAGAAHSSEPPAGRRRGFDLDRAPAASATVDRLAAEGLLFTAHRSVAPSTLPSTRALFSGRLQPEPLGAEEAVLLAERFRAAGYRTALFSGNPYVGPAYGLDRGFDHVAEEVLYEESAGAPFNDNAARVHAAARGWLAALPAGERAFVYLHTIHPHNPYHPPAGLARAFVRGIGSRIDGSTATLTAVQRQRRRVNGADRARLAALYAAAFAWNDGELAGFLEAVGERFAPDDTFLAVTSDHGEELFDHGGVLHGYTLYEEQLRVPLVLWSPGRLPAARVTAPTTTLDLHATLLGLLPGHAPPRPEGGLDLLAQAPPPVRPLLAAAPSVRSGLVSLRHGDWKLVAAPGRPRTWGMGLGRGRGRDPESLFHLGHDPDERDNRVGLGGIEEDWLRARLTAWTPTRRPNRHAPPADPELRKKLEALGYVN